MHSSQFWRGKNLKREGINFCQLYVPPGSWIPINQHSAYKWIYLKQSPVLCIDFFLFYTAFEEIKNKWGNTGIFSCIQAKLDSSYLFQKWPQPKSLNAVYVPIGDLYKQAFRDI